MLYSIYPAHDACAWRIINSLWHKQLKFQNSYQITSSSLKFKLLSCLHPLELCIKPLKGFNMVSPSPTPTPSNSPLYLTCTLWQWRSKSTFQSQSTHFSLCYGWGNGRPYSHTWRENPHWIFLWQKWQEQSRKGHAKGTRCKSWS